MIMVGGGRGFIFKTLAMGEHLYFIFATMDIGNYPRIVKD